MLRMLSPDTNSPGGLFLPGEGPGLCARRALQGAAICEAVTRPSMRFVPLKSLEQQSRLFVHRARQGYVQQRTALINRIRGLPKLQRVLRPNGHDQTGRHEPSVRGPWVESEIERIVNRPHSELKPHSYFSIFISAANVWMQRTGGRVVRNVAPSAAMTGQSLKLARKWAK